VATYTGEADGNFTGPIGQWDRYGPLLASMVRWCGSEDASLPEGVHVMSRLVDGGCRVELHLDPERPVAQLDAMPTVKVLRTQGGVPLDPAELTFEWEGTDLLRTDLTLGSDEVVIPVLQFPGRAPVPLEPVRLPYSYEFAPPENTKGRMILAGMAAASSGVELMNVKRAWYAIPASRHYKLLLPWLVGLALILFLVEIAERRLGFSLPSLRSRPDIKDADKQPDNDEAKPGPSTRSRKRKRSVNASTGASADAPPEANKLADHAGALDAQEQSEALGGAFRAAKKRAKNRTAR
jgi:hypothetical protein